MGGGGEGSEECRGENREATEGTLDQSGSAACHRGKPVHCYRLADSVQSRGLLILDTPSPPDNPHPPSFDRASRPPSPPLFTSRGPSDPSPERWLVPPPHTPLIFPVFLLYPIHSQSDLITHFLESTSLDEQLACIFPASFSSTDIPWAEWDTKREYFTSNLAVYVETAQRRLLKVGKELALREVIAKAAREAKNGREKDGVVLRDGLMSFVVIVKGNEEREWINEFKLKRDRTST